MMSQTAPSMEPHHHETEALPTGAKDNAFVAVFNDGDISEYLYKESAFASGFLSLEPAGANPTAIPVPKRRLAAHFNTGTTPPPRGIEQKMSTSHPNPVQTPLKSVLKPAAEPKTPTKAVDERRPSFIEVSTPSEHKSHQHAPRAHRRHSSEAHLPMSWWPEDDLLARHVWVEKDRTLADEEEDMLEDCLWTDAFYD